MTDKASEAMAWLKMAKRGGWVCPCGREEFVKAVGYEHAVMLHVVVRALEAEVAAWEKANPFLLARAREIVRERTKWKDEYDRMQERQQKDEARADRAEAALHEERANRQAEESHLKARLVRDLRGRRRRESANPGGVYSPHHACPDEDCATGDCDCHCHEDDRRPPAEHTECGT